jgi:hypothetical protein
MDFIERWFGISPDGGDGSLELLWLATIVVAISVVSFRRRIVTWLTARTSRRRCRIDRQPPSSAVGLSHGSKSPP